DRCILIGRDHERGAGDELRRGRHKPETADADAGKSSFLALRVFIREKTEGFVFLQCAAEGEAALRACVSLLDGIQRSCGWINLARKRIARLKRLVAEITERVAVKLVAAALGDDVDHAAGGPAVFRVVVAQNELEFLHAFLGNRRAYAVDGVVAGV